jgi:hypothetical protein
MGAVRIEVLTRTPTEFFHCTHCEVAFHQVGIGKRFRAEQRAAALPADVQAEFDVLASWIADLVERFGQQIQVELVDVASIEGFIKAVRHRLWRYPTIIVDGEVLYRSERRRDGPVQARALEAVGERIGQRLATRAG